jgi:orotate phosphoribosyltransferase
VCLLTCVFVCAQMLVSQLCASSALTGGLADWADFLYMRKDKKKTGTAQQLEGTKEYVMRGPESPLIHAIWVDDALSTGGSMKTGVKILREEYNIHVIGCMYLVDRSKDRQLEHSGEQPLAHPIFEDFKCRAIFDLDEVDALIQKETPE